MTELKLLSIVAVVIGTLILHFGVRATLGRDRPDLAVWVSFDDGFWRFSKSYENGSVGPFNIGDRREVARSKLSEFDLMESGRNQLAQNVDQWRLSLPAKGGGYVTYRVEFNGDQIVKVTNYYAALAGL